MKALLRGMILSGLCGTLLAAEVVVELLVPESGEVEAPPEDSIQGALVREFFQRNKFWNPKISPNGKLIVVFENIDDIREIVLIDIVNGRKLKILAEQNKSLEISSVYWVDDKHIAFTFESYERDRMGLISLIFDNGLATDVNVKVLGDNWYMLDPIPNEPNHAVIVIVKNGAPHVYTVNINNADETVNQLVNKSFQNMIRKTSGWMTDGIGRVRTATEIDHEKITKTVRYRSSHSNRWWGVWRGDPDAIFVPLLAHPDNRWMTVISNEFSDHSVLTTYDRIDHAYGETLFEIEGSDIESAKVNPAKTRVVSVTTIEDGLSEQHFLEDATVTFPKLLDTQAYGSAPYVIDLSFDERHAIVRTSTNDNPGEYYLFNTDENLSYRFGHLRPWLSKFRLGKTRTITTMTDDGLEIESYLTMPDSAYERPPLIIMPHGGPISVRDTRDFDSTVQLFSTLGYAVLQTNYRGSGGFGKSFESKGERQWGRLIEDDIEASLQTVIDLDIVDNSRVCIYGASYGGYSALISAVRSPHLYKCAASFAGVTDMTLLFHEFGVNHSNLIRKVVERIVGDPGDDMELLIQYSPVFNTDRISMPVFLAHGDKDETVDIEHFDRMKKMLEYYGKDAEYMILDGEGHGMRYIKSAMQFYATLDRFFRASMDLPEPNLDKMLHAGEAWPEAVEESVAADEE